MQLRSQKGQMASGQLSVRCVGSCKRMAVTEDRRRYWLRFSGHLMLRDEVKKNVFREMDGFLAPMSVLSTM